MRERKICAVALTSLLSLGASSAAAPSPASRVPEADKLNQRILELYNAAKYSDTVPLASRVLELWEKALGPGDPQTAISLNTLTVLYRALGEYAKGSLARRSLHHVIAGKS